MSKDTILKPPVKNSSGLNFFKGHITHTRTSPAIHKFKYSFFQIWLDVEKPQLVDQISRFWSSKKNNLVRYNRENYLPNKSGQHLSLYQSVCQQILQHTDKKFDGKVYLLASLSYWGYCYNPVSFYICYNKQGQLEYILSEIHNTPWGERFTYVHDKSSQLKNQNSDKLECKFDKTFHVSPFMPMNLQYDWQFLVTEEKILISMNLQQEHESIFNATLNLKSEPLTTIKANKIPFYYPFACFKVLFAIYWNALRLWLKGVTFHNHPENK